MKFGVKNLKCDLIHQQNHQVHSHQSNQFDHSAQSVSEKIGCFKEAALNKIPALFQRVIWSAFILLLLNFLELSAERFGALAKPITPAEHKYEEYYIEHEISSTQAKNSVMTYNSNSFAPPPGCQKCTEEEFQYCGSSLMNDHCCCDKEYFEKLPFIPHTCYLGAQPCTPIHDCATYAKLRDCCCNKLLISKWMAKNSAKLPEAMCSLQLLIILLFINVLAINFKNFVNC